MYIYAWAFLGDTVVKNLSANTGDTRDSGLIPGSERSGGGNLLENSKDRGAWWATVRRVTKTQK